MRLGAKTKPLTCRCCGMGDGVTVGGVTGVAVDPSTMLCLYCQPCPDCGQYGTACYDDNRLRCVNADHRA